MNEDAIDAVMTVSPTAGTRAGSVDAARLVRLGLNARQVPGASAEYADLVTRYLNVPSFAQTVDDIAGGLELIVLGCDRVGGITLAPTDTSPFSMRVTDVMATYTTPERLMFGLVLLTIAAIAYPTADALDDDGRALPTVTVNEVAERVEAIASRLRDQGGPSDPPADAPELEPLWRIVLRVRPTAPTDDGRSNPKTRQGMVRRALRMLVDHGLADEVRDASDPESYRLRSRFRLHVADAAGESLDAIRAADRGAGR